MSRELWLLRHGKAERFDAIEDYDRILKKRGKRNAKSIGKWLKEHNLLPDAIISSPATRAIMTAKLVCDALDKDRHDIQQEKRLYDEGMVRVRSVLAECSPALNTVLLVGHNPELEDLLRHLIDPANLPEVDKLLPTAALARLTLPDDWSHLEKGCAQLISLIYPKDLLEAEESEN